MSTTTGCCPSCPRPRRSARRSTPTAGTTTRTGQGNPASYNQTRRRRGHVHVEQRGPPGARLGRQHRRRAGPAGNGEERDLRAAPPGRPERDDHRRRQSGADRRRPAQARSRRRGLRHRPRPTVEHRLRRDNDGGCATSWATPHMAGDAALARQYYTEGWYPTGHAAAAPRVHAHPARCSRRRWSTARST